MPDAKLILSRAHDKLRARVMKAHKDETILKGGTIAALGYKAALNLAQDAYEMGMMDALKAVEEVRESR